MTTTPPRENDQAQFWNEDGGQRWVQHIDGVEAMLDGLTQALYVRAAARPGERVLDIGCGGGRTSATFADAVGPQGAVTGVDVSRVILDVARARHAARANLDFVLADAGECAWPAAPYDLITSRFGVMFFHDPAAAFTNVRRAAAPGGRLVFMCWRRLDENPWMATAAQAAFTVLPPPPKPEPGAPGPFSFANEARVRGILECAGFADVAFTANDRPIILGTVDAALGWLTEMGPAAQPLREADAAGRERALAAMRTALAAHERDGLVVLGGATWIVSARAA